MNASLSSSFRVRLTQIAGALLLAGTGASAHATVVNFDALADGTTVTNQYAAQGITFSSGAGSVIRVTAQPQYQSTSPNFVCTGPASGSIDCTGTVIFDFAAAVNNLQFDAVGNQNAIGTAFALADIYQNGLLAVTGLQLLVSQGNFLPDHQNLSAYSNITRLVIRSNSDPAGTGYDTISFDPAGTSVPEPASLALVGLALAALGAAGRRKTR